MGGILMGAFLLWFAVNSRDSGAGFTDASPDFGGGMMMIYQF
jgi:hypothetical protein